MKSVILEIKNPADGDLVIINAEAPGGGKISAKHRIVGARRRPLLDEQGFATEVKDVAPETAQDVATSLAAQISKEWMPETVKAYAKPNTNMLVINCSDLFSDVAITTEVHGAGGTQISQMVF